MSEVIDNSNNKNRMIVLPATASCEILLTSSQTFMRRLTDVLGNMAPLSVLTDRLILIEGAYIIRAKATNTKNNQNALKQKLLRGGNLG